MEEITVKHRLRYLIDSQGLLRILLLGTVLLAVLLGLFIFVQFGTRVEPLYFQLNDNQQIIVPVPLDKENITKPALLNWINEVLVTSFSFNYSNQDQQFTKMSSYLSEQAMKAYEDLLNNDEDFKIIKEKQYVVSVNATAAPEILTSKPYRDRYVWQIRVPAVVRFSNALSSGEQEIVMEYLVWRVPETEFSLGITVANFSRKITARQEQRGVVQGF